MVSPRRGPGLNRLVRPALRLQTMLDPSERLQNMQPDCKHCTHCTHWKHSNAAAAAPLLDVDVHELAAAPDRQRAHVPARAGAVMVVPS